MKTIFLGSNTIDFGRSRGSKDKKKRIVKNNPSAEGQAPLLPIGQERTGHKYYQKRRALAYVGGATLGGGIIGGLIGGKFRTNKAVNVGILAGSALTGGSVLLDHAKNKYSPFYQKNLFKKKK